MRSGMASLLAKQGFVVLKQVVPVAICRQLRDEGIQAVVVEPVAAVDVHGSLLVVLRFHVLVSLGDRRRKHELSATLTTQHTIAW